MYVTRTSTPSDAAKPILPPLLPLWPFPADCGWAWGRVLWDCIKTHIICPPLSMLYIIQTFAAGDVCAYEEGYLDMGICMRQKDRPRRGRNALAHLCNIIGGARGRERTHLCCPRGRRHQKPPLRWPTAAGAPAKTAVSKI